MFDVKKKLGNIEKNGDEEGSLQESWVELAPSRTSLCSSVEAVLIDRDSYEGNKDSRLSPVSLQSPHVEFESNLEQVKYRLVKDMLPPGKNTDWIWDWSSRPEAHPPKGLRHRGPIDSTLTTPPNSPEPEMEEAFTFNKKQQEKKKSVFRVDVLFGLVVSNLMTFVLGAAIGYCICKKLSKSETKV